MLLFIQAYLFHVIRLLKFARHAELVKASQQGFIKEFGIHILIKQNEFGELIVGDSHEYHSINEAPQFEQREEINEFIQVYCHEN